MTGWVLLCASQHSKVDLPTHSNLVVASPCDVLRVLKELINLQIISVRIWTHWARPEATGQKAGNLNKPRRVNGVLGVGQSWTCLSWVDGRFSMTLPKFIIGMVFALAIVVLWSCLAGASLGTIFFRAIGCAIVIQLGYFLLVFAMVARSAPAPADKIRDAERKLNSNEAAKGEEFSARRGLH
jgi:exopolysaccharide production repressor protein